MGEVLLGMRTPASCNSRTTRSVSIRGWRGRLVGGMRAGGKSAKPAYPSGFGRFARQGWYLVDGMPVEGWVLAEGWGGGGDRGGWDGAGAGGGG